MKSERNYREELELAQASARNNEELKEENFNRVDADGFVKATVLLKHWAEMAERVMFRKGSFRIEINYNAEAKKTTFAIYTPIEDGKDDSKQEHSES